LAHRTFHGSTSYICRVCTFDRNLSSKYETFSLTPSRPAKLQRLVAGIAEGIDLPLTVKIRIGPSASKINADKVRLCSMPLRCYCIHLLFDAHAEPVTA